MKLSIAMPEQVGCWQHGGAKNKYVLCCVQLDGTHIRFLACTCVVGRPEECPIDLHQIHFAQKNPMWEFPAHAA